MKRDKPDGPGSEESPEKKKKGESSATAADEETEKHGLPEGLAPCEGYTSGPSLYAILNECTMAAKRHFTWVKAFHEYNVKNALQHCACKEASTVPKENEGKRFAANYNFRHGAQAMLKNIPFFMDEVMEKKKKNSEGTLCASAMDALLILGVQKRYLTREECASTLKKLAKIRKEGG